MKVFLVALALWASTSTSSSSSNGCSVIIENSASVVDCSNASSIAEVVEYMNALSEVGTVFMDKFRILENPNIDTLVENLFADVQFTTVEISGCSSLKHVEDFLGASRTTLTSLIFNYNGYMEVPALKAENLESIDILTNSLNLTVKPSAFKNMKNIESLQLMNAVIEPLSFYSLKKLEVLVLPFLSSSMSSLVAGTLLFGSPVLQYVYIPHNVFQNIEYQAIDGFPAGSTLFLTTDIHTTKDAFAALLDGGANLYFDKNAGCDCKVAWIRLGPYFDQYLIPCAQQGIYLHQVPEEEFADC